MFESFGFEDVTPQQAAVVLGLVQGLAFGVMAQITRFCFRRALIGEDSKAASGIWLTALAVALLGTQAAASAGWISFAEHRFMASDMPVLAITLGGLMFGAGMVLTRGCASRLTVLAGSGNLRAVLVLVVFALVAHATLKGFLAPVRVALGGVTVPLGDMSSLSSLPGGAWFYAALIALMAFAAAVQSGAPLRHLALAALIGTLVPLGWVGTGFVLFDEFDPIALESMSFTSPATESLFWIIASTAIPAGFGTGLLGGTLMGALGASLSRGSFAWVSFETPRETGRYIAGAALMGVGGVLAGGCTLGAGLSGVPTLSVAAIIAFGMIGLGVLSTQAWLNRSGDAPGATPTRPKQQPAL